MTSAGDLRERLVILRSTPTRNSVGEEIQAWSTLTTVWAQIAQPTGREAWSAKQVNARVSTRIRIRRRTDVTPQMRVTNGGRTFEILAVLDPDGLSVWTDLLCEEMTGETL